MYAVLFINSCQRYDCGPVLLQHKYRISSAVTSEMLSCELADLGVEMVSMM